MTERVPLGEFMELIDDLKKQDEATLNELAALAKCLEYLTRSGYRSLWEAALKEGRSEREIWLSILDEAGLPECEIPDRLKTH